MSQRNQLSINSPIILWGVNVSPYVRKVMVALAEKQLTFEQKNILPKILLQATGQIVPDDFDKASALGKIPAIQIGDFCIADSAVITAYLDRKFTQGTQLYPDNPESYARTLWFERYADVVLADVIYKKIFFECVIKPSVLKQETDHALVEKTKKTELRLALDYLNQTLSQSEWIIGNEFTAADIAIVMQLLALKMTDFEFPNQHWPRMQIYLKKVTSRDSFKKNNL